MPADLIINGHRFKTIRDKRIGFYDKLWINLDHEYLLKEAGFKKLLTENAYTQDPKIETKGYYVFLTPKIFYFELQEDLVKAGLTLI